MGKFNKTISKLLAALTPVYIHTHTRQIPMVAILRHNRLTQQREEQKKTTMSFSALLTTKFSTSRQAGRSTEAQ